jgi:hypothetical protein
MLEVPQETHRQGNRDTAMSPLAKVMVCKRADNHAGMHIAAKTQLDGDALLLNDSTVRRLDVNHVAEAVGPPGQQRVELAVGRRSGCFGKVQRDAQAGGLCTLEGGREDAHVAFSWVTAEVDADNAGRAVGEGEVDDGFGFGGRVTAVDGEDEEGAQGAGGMGVVRV